MQDFVAVVVLNFTSKISFPFTILPTQSRMLLDPSSNFFSFVLVFFLYNASALSCVIFCSKLCLHKLIKAPDDDDRKYINAEKCTVIYRALIVSHQHGINQSMFVLYTVIEQVAQLIKQCGNFGDLNA